MKTIVILLAIASLYFLGCIAIQKGADVVKTQNCNSYVRYMVLHGPETLEYERYEEKFYTEDCNL